MRKKKIKNPMKPWRSACRLIWSRSAERKAIIKASLIPDLVPPSFDCKACRIRYPIQMADVDHEPSIGQLDSLQEIQSFINRLYYGPQQVLCKICHAKKTKEQRKKKK